MAPPNPSRLTHRFRATRGLLSVVCAAAVSFTTVVASADEPVRQVTEVKVLAAGDSTDVVVTCSSTPRFSARLDAGKRLLVDISDAEVKGASAALTDKVGVVGGVMTQSFKDGASSTTRVAVTLLEKATYRVHVEGNNLHITVTKEGSKESAPAPVTPTAPAAPPSQAASAEVASRPTVTDVKFSHKGTQDRVVLVGASKSAFSQSVSKAGVTRLELRGTSLVDDAQRTLDVSAFNGSIRTISAYRTNANGGGVIVEATHADDSVGEVTIEGGSLVWTFSRKASSSSTSTSATAPTNDHKPGVASDGGAARRTRTVSREAEISGIPRVETGLREDAGDSAEAAPFVSGPLGQQKRFGGARVNIDLKDADIHNVLRILADVGKVNIITSDAVKGDVTLKLTNVPWDQALDVVLQSKGLGMTRQGNLIRVAPLADLEKEREMAIQRRKQELELAPVETRLIPVSYSNAGDVQARAKELLSARGSIAVDERTNMLIARDVAGNLNQIEELVRSLDTQTPQVLVEARIVEATSRYLRDVGIQWGGDATFSPATGNPTVSRSRAVSASSVVQATRTRRLRVFRRSSETSRTPTSR
ncbi:MAG: secretin N-terminal domain-containing protein [Polyangiaceae bacterium]